MLALQSCRSSFVLIFMLCVQVRVIMGRLVGWLYYNLLGVGLIIDFDSEL